MVRGRLHIASAILALGLLVGCADPYRFSVNTQDPVDCRIFTGLHSAEKTAYGFDMQPDAVVGITALGKTQYYWQSMIRTTSGDGFQLLLRPVIEEAVKDSGFILTFYAKGGMRLDSAGTLLLSDPHVQFPQDSLTFVTVYNEEDVLEVTVGCDTVLRRKSQHIESDDLGIRTLGGTSLEVHSPIWKRIEFPHPYEVVAGRNL